MLLHNDIIPTEFESINVNILLGASWIPTNSCWILITRMEERRLNIFVLGKRRRKVITLKILVGAVGTTAREKPGAIINLNLYH